MIQTSASINFSRGSFERDTCLVRVEFEASMEDAVDIMAAAFVRDPVKSLLNGLTEEPPDDEPVGQKHLGAAGSDVMCDTWDVGRSAYNDQGKAAAEGVIEGLLEGVDLKNPPLVCFQPHDCPDDLHDERGDLRGDYANKEEKTQVSDAEERAELRGDRDGEADTQEKIDADANILDFWNYWDCQPSCTECRSVVDEQRPFERYETNSCNNAMRLDLLRRQRELDSRTMARKKATHVEPPSGKGSPACGNCGYGVWRWWPYCPMCGAEFEGTEA